MFCDEYGAGVYYRTRPPRHRSKARDRPRCTAALSIFHNKWDNNEFFTFKCLKIIRNACKLKVLRAVSGTVPRQRKSKTITKSTKTTKNNMEENKFEETFLDLSNMPASMDELLKSSESSQALTKGTIVKGKITEKRPDSVLIDIGYKAEGEVPASEFIKYVI